MDSPIRYVAELDHVREVSLHGTADLSFWTARLLAENLVPVQRDGRARLVVMAAEMVFMGIRFTEVSFSVPVVAPGPAALEAAFLVHAFNSSRLFASCERLLFATPYSHAECHVSVAASPSIRVALGGETVFHAEMSSSMTDPARTPARSGDEGWEGPVFIPTHRRFGVGDTRLFFGRIKGHTQACRFMALKDTVSIAPPSTPAVLKCLLDSGFVGEEWFVREDASHGKSKTYRRSEVFGQVA